VLVIVSRSHQELLRRLFELEVPEVFNGTVEIKSIAREAGFRSKIAVAAKQEGIDPVGCCVGLRGIRIQNIVNEINGEKIDVVSWSADPATFIASALSPAHIVSVELNKPEQVATVIVPDKQLSLAIGKEGQNARLAAKLTGWRIDIKSVSAAETEKIPLTQVAPRPSVEKAKEVREEVSVPVEPEPGAEELPAELELTPEELGLIEEPAVPEEAPVVVEAAAVVEEILAPPQVVMEQSQDEARSQLRFAEDIIGVRRSRDDSRQPKSKKKKKTTHTRDSGDDSAKARRVRRDYSVVDEDEDFS
jgi:N utilization substance protein A